MRHCCNCSTVPPPQSFTVFFSMIVPYDMIRCPSYCPQSLSPVEPSTFVLGTMEAFQIGFGVQRTFSGTTTDCIFGHYDPAYHHRLCWDVPHGSHDAHFSYHGSHQPTSHHRWFVAVTHGGSGGRAHLPALEYVRREFRVQFLSGSGDTVSARQKFRPLGAT